MQHVVVRLLQIAHIEPLRLGGVGAGDDAGQFDAAVGVFGRFATRFDPQQNDAAVAVARRMDVANSHARPDPAPGAKRIAAKRLGQFGHVVQRSGRPDRARIRLDPRQGVRQRIL